MGRSVLSVLGPLCGLRVPWDSFGWGVWHCPLHGSMDRCAEQEMTNSGCQISFIPMNHEPVVGCVRSLGETQALQPGKGLGKQRAACLVSQSADWPGGQIQPATYFCTAYELRMVFKFLSGGEKSKEDFVTCKNYIKSKFQSPPVRSYEHSHARSSLLSGPGCSGPTS